MQLLLAAPPRLLGASHAGTPLCLGAEVGASQVGVALALVDSLERWEREEPRALQVRECIGMQVLHV